MVACCSYIFVQVGFLRGDDAVVYGAFLAAHVSVECGERKDTRGIYMSKTWSQWQILIGLYTTVEFSSVQSAGVCMCVSRCEENAGLYTALRLDNVFNFTGQTDQLVTHSLTLLQSTDSRSWWTFHIEIHQDTNFLTPLTFRSLSETCQHSKKIGDLVNFNMK